MWSDNYWALCHSIVVDAIVFSNLQAYKAPLENQEHTGTCLFTSDEKLDIFRNKYSSCLNNILIYFTILMACHSIFFRRFHMQDERLYSSNPNCAKIHIHHIFYLIARKKPDQVGNGISNPEGVSAVECIHDRAIRLTCLQRPLVSRLLRSQATTCKHPTAQRKYSLKCLYTPSPANYRHY